ncbi:MAG: YdcH family protein [Nitrospirae bacterium]|nr:YdcH family protein [Nitrospirota bacterium]MBF0518891.1 YdcH family protein [Nitrospirota bacterium]MBF0534603.1 YdcH family protein [Nitrospirota bacterium]MBF0616353.1 YdcH family protein [Nitrospirota bacterium]
MTEQEIVDKLRTGNEVFKKIEDEHRTLDKQIYEYDSKVYLTLDEDMHRKMLQKEKLQRKDKLAEMIREFKKFAN